MNLPDEIKTIDDYNEVKTVINKSSFIAQVYQIFSESEVKEQLTKAKKKYYEASHHCYAFKLADGTFRYSDAGEPNGTAGIRIQNAIEHFNLSNQLVIVSTIFGGVKLGVGPLGKAYYEAASEAIKNSKIKDKNLFQKATISAEFDQVSFVRRILANYNSTVEDSKYDNLVELRCLLKSSEINQITSKILELSKNSIEIIISEESLYI